MPMAQLEILFKRIIINSYRMTEIITLFRNKKCKKLSIVEITVKAGFDYYNSFVKFFKRKYKLTPKVYRIRL